MKKCKQLKIQHQIAQLFKVFQSLAQTTDELLVFFLLFHSLFPVIISLSLDSFLSLSQRRLSQSLALGPKLAHSLLCCFRHPSRNFLLNKNISLPMRNYCSYSKNNTPQHPQPLVGVFLFSHLLLNLIPTAPPLNSDEG